MQRTTLENKLSKPSLASLAETMPRCCDPDLVRRSSCTAPPPLCAGGSSQTLPSESKTLQRAVLRNKLPMGAKSFSARLPCSQPSAVESPHPLGTTSPSRTHLDGQLLTARQAVRLPSGTWSPGHASAEALSGRRSVGRAPIETPIEIRSSTLPPVEVRSGTQSPNRAPVEVLSGTRSPCRAEAPRQARTLATSVAASGTTSPTRLGSASPHSPLILPSTAMLVTRCSPGASHSLRLNSTPPH